MINNFMSSYVAKGADNFARFFILAILKGKTIETVYTTFPETVSTLNPFRLQGWIMRIFFEKFKLLESLLLYTFWQRQK